ncbi:MAG TPA: ferrous iron transport protein B [Verrucomicrobiae bacterium]|nr:ferrous iron transport protein B [Verrucomicrobiae bacterium]
MNSAVASGQTSRPGNFTQAYVVLTGNPNCGKTTLFNTLTGLSAKVGNYAGVTVERKEGKLLDSGTGFRSRSKTRGQDARAAMDIRVLDLPGTYSLSPQSLDEQVSRDVLLNRLPELPPPDLIVVVVDASNLQRNLYYATQVIELGHPTLIALNMVDVAEANGHSIDAGQLSSALGVPVIPIVASSGKGISELKQEILSALDLIAEQKGNAAAETSETHSTAKHFCELPESFSAEASALSELLAKTFHERRAQARAEALLILSNERALASSLQHYPRPVQDAVGAARKRLEAAGVDWRGAAIEGRYACVSAIQQRVTTELARPGENFSDKLDRVLTHKLWGTLIFLGIMALMFQSIFTFAQVPMNAMQSGVDWLGKTVGGLLPVGDLNSLLVDGVIAGVGAVVVFLPQILLLFLFIGFLEDTGYMARAAFLMDRLMSKVGLHGKSFIPMLSSFACAIPGIMATRTIESPKDRLVTILVAPLMSCSARLPVYTLLIAACVPNITIFGFLKLTALTMLSMYLLGIVMALLMAWLFKKTLLKGETPMLIMELPPYKRPLLRVVMRHMWDRSKIFLTRAGTVILGINIILWFLATYPRSSAIHNQFETQRAAVRQSAQTESQKETTLRELDKDEAGASLRNSFAGRMGRAIEPVIAPLGFDWKMGIGIVSSFAAREVFVSTMSTVYNVGNGNDSGSDTQLVETLKQQKHDDGTPVYTTLTGITLMVFYVLALQCVSTVAIVRRETNSWKWPLFQWLYMGILAWGLAFITFHAGLALGWG